MLTSPQARLAPKSSVDEQLQFSVKTYTFLYTSMRKRASRSFSMFSGTAEDPWIVACVFSTASHFRQCALSFIHCGTDLYPPELRSCTHVWTPACSRKQPKIKVRVVQLETNAHAAEAEADMAHNPCALISLPGCGCLRKQSGMQSKAGGSKRYKKLAFSLEGVRSTSSCTIWSTIKAAECGNCVSLVQPCC